MDNSRKANHVPSVPIVCDDTACQWCDQGPSQGKKLKRCRACNIAVYCGKECQTAAWPTHKGLCRSRKNPQGGEMPGRAGYDSFLALARGVQDWVNIHKYSMSVLAHATIRSTGGVAASLRHGRMVVFVLSSRRAESPPAADINPAEAFSIVGVSNQEGEYVRPFREISDKIKRGIDGGFCREPNRTPAGCVPVLYVVKGTETPTVSSLYSVYLPSNHPDGTVDQETVAFFHDICRIFMNFVNHGTVIQRPADGRRGTPPSGFLVPPAKKGDWTWQPDLGETAWQEMDRLMSQQVIPFNTTGSATELWSRFQQW